MGKIKSIDGFEQSDDTGLPKDMDDYTVADYEGMMKQREPLDNIELKAIIDKKRKPEKPRPLV